MAGSKRTEAKGAALRLELLQEVVVANAYALPSETRVTLQSWKVGGRGRVLQKALGAEALFIFFVLTTINRRRSKVTIKLDPNFCPG